MPITEDRSQLEILYNVSRQLAASLDLHEVLARVLLLSTGNLGAERASLIVLDHSGKPCDAVILYKGELSSASSETIASIIRSGLAGWVVRQREPVILANTQEDSRWLARPYEQSAGSPPKSALCVPVLVRQRIVGVLTIVHPQIGYFTASHLKLQQAIADLAGIAIHNAQLYENAEHSRQLYQHLFEGSPDLIFITTLNGRVIDCNRQAVLRSGQPRRSILKTQIPVFDPEAEKILARMKQVRIVSKTNVYQSTLRMKDQEDLPVEVSVTRITYRDLDCLQWIFRDISARRQLDALRDDLAAMIYHDLRSPLANIISGLELLSETLPPDPDPQAQQLLQIIGRSSAHMQRLVSSLLDINRLESGQQITRFSRVNWQELVSGCLEIITPLFRSKEIEVVSKIPRKIPLVMVDEDMIRRVVINLLENAVKFSPQRGRVLVKLKNSRNELVVIIEDQGPGIPENARERVFEKFIRLEKETTSRGLGLGLTFCRLAVQAHGGKIWVENASAGGCRFIFTMPHTKQQEKLQREE